MYIYIYLERAIIFNFYIAIYACDEQSNPFSFLKTCTNLICIMFINVYKCDNNHFFTAAFAF